MQGTCIWQQLNNVNRSTQKLLTQAVQPIELKWPIGSEMGRVSLIPWLKSFPHVYGRLVGNTKT